MSKADDFDWSPENPDLVVERQPAIAVYENAGGAITIRREREWDEEDDVFIVITRANVPALVRAILKATGVELVRPLGNGSYEDLRPDIDWQAVHADFDKFEANERAAEQIKGGGPKDPTAAERQRKSRASRNGTVTEAVTSVTSGATADRHIRDASLFPEPHTARAPALTGG